MVQNIFAMRNSELSSPDEEFAQNFAADALQVLPPNAFKPGALVIRSAPGGGKTSLLRMFTPGPLEQTLRNHSVFPFDEIYGKLQALGAVGPTAPRLLGVYISSQGGYSEIGPPLPQAAAAGLFKALLNARIVLRTLRAVTRFWEVDYDDARSLSRIRVMPGATSRDAGQLPIDGDAPSLRRWAEDIEQRSLKYLDTLQGGVGGPDLPGHVAIDAIQWLGAARFFLDEVETVCTPLLMFDDVQRLRPWQRDALFSECMEHRTPLIVWIAEQTKALDSSGVLTVSRAERDHHVVQLEKFWGNDKGNKFQNFAADIANRRLRQAGIDVKIDVQLNSRLTDRDLGRKIETAIESLKNHLGAPLSPHYEAWVKPTLDAPTTDPFSLAVELGKTRIMIARDRRRGLPAFDFEGLESDASPSGVVQAAERMICTQYLLPYFYGFDRVTRLASFNIEEFLQICASLFELIHAARVVKTGGSSTVSASDQDAAIKQLAARRFTDISRSVRHGEMAQKLVQAAGRLCKEKTYLTRAPYAPGVTGFAISAEERIELSKANAAGSTSVYFELAQVLTSCVAQNVLDMREIKQGSRAVTVFYLNRMLCAHFDLVYHYGGWQKVSLRTLIEWSRGNSITDDARKLL